MCTQKWRASMLHFRLLLKVVHGWSKPWSTISTLTLFKAVVSNHTVIYPILICNRRIYAYDHTQFDSEQQNVCIQSYPIQLQQQNVCIQSYPIQFATEFMYALYTHARCCDSYRAWRIWGVFVNVSRESDCKPVGCCRINPGCGRDVFLQGLLSFETNLFPIHACMMYVWGGFFMRLWPLWTSSDRVGLHEFVNRQHTTSTHDDDDDDDVSF